MTLLSPAQLRITALMKPLEDKSHGPPAMSARRPVSYAPAREFACESASEGWQSRHRRRFSSGVGDAADETLADAAEYGGGRLIGQIVRRSTRIAPFANRHFNGSFAKKRHIQRLGFSSRAARAENVVLLSVIRTQEVTHVLHHAQHGDVHFAEHSDRLHGIQQRDLLWRANNHGARERQQL